MAEVSLSALRAFVERGLDRARADDKLAAGSLMLGLLALRYLCTILKPDPWRQLRNELVHGGHAYLALQDSIMNLAGHVEASFPDLDSVFTQGLLLDLQRIDALLSLWIVEAELLHLPDNAEDFGRLFNRLVDDLTGGGGTAMQATTPRHLAELMVGLAEPLVGGRLFDPCCGVGSCLASAVKAASEGGAATPQVAGQEVNQTHAALAKLRLRLLTGITPRIEVGDSLRRPAFVREDRLELFDRVFCHPPLGQRLAEASFAERDWLARFRYGKPGTSSDTAFLQHAVAHLNSDGRLVALIAHGILFRSGRDGHVRRNLVLADLIDSVIGLPSGALPGIPLEVALVVIRRSKPLDRRHHVTFVDASGYRGAIHDSKAWAVLAKNILAASVDAVEMPGLSRILTTQQIEEEDFSLQPRRYVARPPQAPMLDVFEAVREARQLELRAQAAATEMDLLINELEAGQP